MLVVTTVEHVLVWLWKMLEILLKAGTLFSSGLGPVLEWVMQEWPETYDG